MSRVFIDGVNNRRRVCKFQTLITSQIKRHDAATDSGANREESVGSDSSHKERYWLYRRRLNN